MILAVTIFCSSLSLCAGQSSAGEKGQLESRYIIDMPTAGVLSKGNFSVSSWLQNRGNILVEAHVGIFTNCSVGLSFGGNNLLGNSTPETQHLPGLILNVRLIDETRTQPAVKIGFSNQGRGENADARFASPSPGVYLAVSKSYAFLGRMDVHGALGYSLEHPMNDFPLNYWLGIEKSIGSYISISVEFNPTLQLPSEFLSKRGLLNAGLKVYSGKGFTLEFQARDLLKNSIGAQTFSRTFSFEYITKIFYN